jgi:hypothetical protein
MMMRMSKKFEKRWGEERMDETLPLVVLRPRLKELIRAAFVRRAGCLLLEPLAAQASGPEAFQDFTGYEAFINKVHIEDFIDIADETPGQHLHVLIQQGVKSATELAERLDKEGSYRVLLSLDAELPTITLRFFERREGEPWGADDPDAFQLEEVLMIDTRA